MTSYLGDLGYLVPVAAPAVLRPRRQAPISTATTLGGTKVAQVAAGPAHREWQVQTAATTPEVAATMEAFLAGEFGVGPWWWIEVWAQTTNVLPPQVASLEAAWRSTVHGGPVILPSGDVAGRSLIASGTTYIDRPAGSALRLPCVPSRPVTASAWLSSQGQDVAIIARDSAGATLATSSVGTTPGLGLQRAAATLTPPEGTHHVIVRFRGSGRIVRPALTWTPQALPYGAGAGCQQALVADLNQDVIQAVNDTGARDRLATWSYTVLEVGP